MEEVAFRRGAPENNIIKLGATANDSYKQNCRNMLESMKSIITSITMLGLMNAFTESRPFTATCDNPDP